MPWDFCGCTVFLAGFLIFGNCRAAVRRVAVLCLALARWRSEIRAARRSGNLEARQKAEDLINVLSSRGYFDFGELLNEPVE
jgi:hypothetical protein